ncbi:MAG: DUF1735 domain-containing protein [Sphingobacteriaceae bacterium]|nr:MAG: DUF1735 domain-containing protein [Sphingobacteriaceae bacterium]
MKVKLYFKPLVYLSLLFVITGLAGCEKNDSAANFGDNYIFIPQATVSGGTNLNYTVPSGLDTNTYNYRIDTKNNKVNVLLGVSCSGKVANAGYTVNLATRTDTITQLINNGQIKVAPNATKTVMQLPADAYSLPTAVTVPSSSYMTGYYLSIDKTKLKTYAGQKVALCVIISNPTNYVLNQAYKQVIIIIDVDALKLI